MRRFFIILAIIGIEVLLSLPACAGTTLASPSATAFFVNMKNHETVHNPITIKFGVTGMVIELAGEAKPNAGHFHLLIDTALSPDEMNYAIVKDDQHLHFGKGETETILNLKPGTHTLQIVMGDGRHELHNPPVMSKIITIKVE